MRTRVKKSWPHFCVLSSMSSSLLMALIMNICAENTGNRAEIESKIIYPEIINSRWRTKRVVRNLGPSDKFQIQFHAFDKSFNASLKPINEFIAPNAAAIVIGDSGEILHSEDLIGSYYKGALDGDQDSFVSLTKAEGLAGVIVTKDAHYFFHPLHDNNNNIKQAHIITRHSERLPDLLRHEIKSATAAHGGTNQYIRQRRNTRDEPIEKTIETLIVIDQKMTQHYGLDAARQYALTVANIAHDILRDPSIGQHPINLVVVKVLILVAQQENLIINHHAKNTLASFGKWTTLQSNKFAAQGDGFDFAILLTRYNICKNQEQPCDNNGISHTGGMCKFPSSVSVIQDRGLISAFSIAHHIGHSLGIEHDKPGTACFGQNRIMKSNAGYGEGAFVWSTCNVEYLQRFLRTDQSRCLDDVPSKVKRNSAPSYPNSGAIYDIVAQCELFAGEGAKGCYIGDRDEICIELQCLLPNTTSCARTGKPPADGTVCGESKWCKHGRCVEKHDADASVINGAWSTWGEFSPCTRPCGGGISYRERKCQNPTPIHGGKYCEGEARTYSICNKKPCPDVTSLFRKQQCKRKSGSFLGDVQFAWTYKGGSGKDGTKLEPSCNLVCTAQNKQEILKDFGRSIDGTDCYLFNLNVPGKCVAGECISVGCDLELGSREKLDRCGICKGDGSSCKEKLGLAIRTPAAVFVNVTDRGRNTDKLKISENTTKSFNKTVHGNKKAYNDTLRGKTGINSTNLEIKKSNANKTEDSAAVDHLFNVLRKLKTLRTLMKSVLLKKCSNDIKCFDRYKYFDLKRSEISHPKIFEWVLISSGCSVTCGIGTESLYTECRRVDDGSPVGRRFCSMLPEPVERAKACRMPNCATRWLAGDWESCSKSCGAGLQSRDVFCVKTITEDFIVPDILCNAVKKPSNKQICNKQACPAKWVTEPFGKCSTTCGKGLQLREVFCKMNAQNRGLIIVADSHCNAVERPEREMFCNVHNPCPGDENCGGNFTEASGSLTSPNYPELYPSNRECISEITVAKGKLIKLEFIELKINGSRKSDETCEGDFLRITDSYCNDPSGKPYSLYCSSQIPENFIMSTSNSMCLKFFSDDAGTNNGFSLQYSTVDRPVEQAKIFDICDVHGRVLKSSFGALTSPNYPATYPSNEYCKVTISAMDQSGFILAIKGFNVGAIGSNKACEDDFLELYHDGISEKVCGRQKTRKATIKSDSFTVIFHSGTTKIGGTGFVMTFITKTVLQGQLRKINKKKQEQIASRSSLRRTMALPKLTDVTAVHLQPVKEQQRLLVDALTSFKKSNISRQHLNQSGNLSAPKNISDKRTLETVLEMLGGGETKVTSTKEQIKKLSSNNAPNKTTDKLPFEDYTKTGNPSTQRWPMLERQGPVVSLSAGRVEEPRNPRPDTGPSGQVFGRTLTSKDLWTEYWKLYSEYHWKRRSNVQNPSAGTRYYVYPRSNWPSNACPVTSTLQCPGIARFSRCQPGLTCGYSQEATCCPTACPYNPFVCLWA